MPKGYGYGSEGKGKAMEDKNKNMKKKKMTQTKLDLVSRSQLFYLIHLSWHWGNIIRLKVSGMRIIYPQVH